MPMKRYVVFDQVITNRYPCVQRIHEREFHLGTSRQIKLRQINSIRVRHRVPKVACTAFNLLRANIHLLIMFDKNKTSKYYTNNPFSQSPAGSRPSLAFERHQVFDLGKYSVAASGTFILYSCEQKPEFWITTIETILHIGVPHLLHLHNKTTKCMCVRKLHVSA